MIVHVCMYVLYVCMFQQFLMIYMFMFWLHCLLFYLDLWKEKILQILNVLKFKYLLSVPQSEPEHLIPMYFVDN